MVSTNPALASSARPVKLPDVLVWIVKLTNVLSPAVRVTEDTLGVQVMLRVEVEQLMATVPA